MCLKFSIYYLLLFIESYTVIDIRNFLNTKKYHAKLFQNMKIK